MRMVPRSSTNARWDAILCGHRYWAIDHQRRVVELSRQCFAWHNVEELRRGRNVDGQPDCLWCIDERSSSTSADGNECGAVHRHQYHRYQ